MLVSNDIGIDLGTASILVYIKGKGVVLKEPSVVAIDRDSNKIMAIGEEARLMIGRTPSNIIAVRPLRQGVISDYTVTEKMLKYFINKAVGKRTLRKPRVAVCIPSGATEVEKRQLRTLHTRPVPVRFPSLRSRLQLRSVPGSIFPKHAET